MEKTKVITVVNEPQAEYRVSGWNKELKEYSFNDFIYEIENETILFYPPIVPQFIRSFGIPKRKLSTLRGKMTKQSEKEIDKQISKLRGEWDTNT